MQVIRGIHSTAAPRFLRDKFILVDDRMSDPPRYTRWDRWKDVLGNLGEFRCRLKFERRDMGGLKLLVAEKECFRGILGNLPTDLVWLRWHECPHTILPRWFPIDKLRVLEFVDGHFQTLWHSSYCKHNQIPTQLRELNIIGSLAKFPKSIGALKQLEKIVLDGSKSCLKALPDEFCRLHSLRHLELRKCKELRSLPERFGDLTNLQLLDLEYCSNLEMLPDSFGRLIQLQHLGLGDCTNLMIRQRHLGTILTLRHVDFSSCHKLKVLPSQITRQAILQEINLQGTSLKELPNEIGELHNLKVLKLGSSLLQSLPPSMWTLSGLITLELTRCGGLNCLSESGVDEKPESPEEESSRGGLEQLKNLEDLTILSCPLRHCTPFTGVPRKDVHGKEPARLLPKLKDLTLSTTEVSNISITEDICPNLQYLWLSDNRRLVEAEVLLGTLKFINLRDCRALKRITGLSLPGKLSRLDISRCGQLEELPNLAELSCLQDLDVSGCGKLKAIEGAANLRSLERDLTQIGCFGLKSMIGMEQLQRLKYLRISADNGEIWNSIATLQALPSYKRSTTTLTVRSVPGVESGVESILSSASIPLTLLKFSTTKDAVGYYESFKFAREIESCSARIVYLVLRAPSRGAFFQVNFPFMHYSVFTKEGEWINICVFTHTSVKSSFDLESDSGDRKIFEVSRSTEIEVKKGWMVIGSNVEGERNILEVWYKLLTLMRSQCTLYYDHKHVEPKATIDSYSCIGDNRAESGINLCTKT